MNLKKIEGINLYKDFQTRILKEIQIEDCKNLFGNDRVIYLVPNLFTKKLSRKRKINFKGNTAEEKKREIAKRVPKLYKIVSIDYSEEYKQIFMPSFREEMITHLPILRLNKLLDKIFQVIYVIFFLWKEKENYDKILFYNFFRHTSIPSIVIHFLLGKRLIVDFEDNYETFSLRVLRRLVSKYIDGAILVNKNQKELLENNNIETSVINAFANLDYVKSKLDSKVDNFRIIYSGKIDRVRGVDLIPSFSYWLQQNDISHKIYITGYGDFNDVVGSCSLMSQVEKNIHFLGFISPKKLDKLLSSTNLALSFDKPDLDQNRYLYPSKIQLYSKYNLPILTLE